MEELIPITLFMCIAAVMILRPLTRRLGGLIEVMTRERAQARLEDSNMQRIIALLEHTSRRLDQIEDRLDFTERLVSDRHPGSRRPLHRGRASLDNALEGEYLAR